MTFGAATFQVDVKEGGGGGGGGGGKEGGSYLKVQLMLSGEKVNMLTAPLGINEQLLFLRGGLLKTLITTLTMLKISFLQSKCNGFHVRKV